MNADGSGQQRLTTQGAKPDWSPDGRTIAFTSERDGNGEIYTMNADGSQQRNLTRTRDQNESGLVWSPAQKSRAGHGGMRAPRRQGRGAPGQCSGMSPGLAVPAVPQLDDPVAGGGAGFERVVEHRRYQLPHDQNFGDGLGSSGNRACPGEGAYCDLLLVLQTPLPPGTHRCPVKQPDRAEGVHPGRRSGMTP